MTAIWFPIFAFVALKLDHSVANMFIIPLGLLCGAKNTVSQMLLKNLIPVTLGNIVGGALCVMAPFGSAFGKWGRRRLSKYCLLANYVGILFVFVSIRLFVRSSSTMGGVHIFFLQ
jgi:formate/nitrite transporter FocA (FNT family)